MNMQKPSHYYLIWFLGIFFASLWTNLNFKVSPFKSASNSQASLSLSYRGIPIGLGGTTGTSTWLTWKIFVLFQFPMKTNQAILHKKKHWTFFFCFSKHYHVIFFADWDQTLTYESIKNEKISYKRKDLPHLQKPFQR